jgi:hypothetical protein
MTKLPKKVMLVEEYKDGTSFWRVPCDCSDPDHDVHLWFEVDDDGIAALRITRQLGYYKNSWYDDAPVYERFLRWCDRMWDRFKAANKILFKGYLTMDGDVCLTKDGIDGLQYALTEGSKAMVKAEKAFAAKRKVEAEAKKDA